MVNVTIGIAIAGLGVTFFIGVILYLKYGKKITQSATESELDADNARNTSFIYAGEGGHSYNSRVAGKIIKKGTFAWIDLADGTHLQKLSLDEIEIKKDWNAAAGEPTILCNRDADNERHDWAAPEKIKEYLRRTELDREKIREEEKEKVVKDINLKSKLEAHQGMHPLSSEHED